jgi:hypothetical protein
MKARGQRNAAHGRAPVGHIAAAGVLCAVTGAEARPGAAASGPGEGTLSARKSGERARMSERTRTALWRNQQQRVRVSDGKDGAKKSGVK